MVRILGFHCRDPGSIPGGTEIPKAPRRGQKKKKERKSLLIDLKMVPQKSRTVAAQNASTI